MVEVKSWSARDCASLEEVAEQQRDFCLQKLATGFLQLSTDHPYFLQCQLQLCITKRAYCDFVVCNRAGLHIERIYTCRPAIEFGKGRAILQAMYTCEILAADIRVGPRIAVLLIALSHS